MATGFEREQEQISPEDYSVLICDDDESIRSLLKAAVREWGFKVGIVSSGEEALEYFKVSGPPDVLLTDINMGGMSGVELAEQVKRDNRESEVIIMTAQATFETAVEAMRIGVFDYLCKPFDDLDDIRSTLVHVCRRIYLRLRNEYLVSELARKHREIESLATMSKNLAENLDLARVVQIGCEGLSRAFGDCQTAFFQYLSSQRAVMGAARHPSNLFGGTRPSRVVPREHTNDLQSLVNYFRNVCADPIFFKQIDSAGEAPPDEPETDPARGWRSIPFVTRDIPRGLFLVRPRNWNEAEDGPLMQRYMRTLSTAFENALMHAQLVDSSTKDGLTGLCNVSHLRERLDGEIRRATRLRHPMTLLFMDVDHFKHYNDTNGHPAGDEVLRILAGTMVRSFRTTDLCARYGGEEFCVMMPDTALPDAFQRAEKFRAEVESTSFPDEDSQPLGRITISIGVAEYPTHDQTVDKMIEIADAALYEAKKKRNHVVAGKVEKGYLPPFESHPVRSSEIKVQKRKAGEVDHLPRTGTF
jgi:diguanylate cyclase (GGDEF)-like protein